jgi:hypothetical protein
VSLRRGPGMATGRAWAVLLAAADASSEGPKRPSARVLHGFGALAKPGAKRQTQEGVAGWPDFDPDFAEEPGLIEPYLSAIRVGPHYRHFQWGFPHVIAHCGFTWTSCCGWRWRGDSARAETTLFQV